MDAPSVAVEVPRVMWLVMLVVMPGLVWLAPGWLLSRWLLPHADRLERVVTALTAGIVTVAPTAYLLTLCIEVPTGPAWILGCAASWAFVGALLERFCPRQLAPPPSSPPNAMRFLLGVAVFVPILLALLTSPYGVHTARVFWHCPHLSCLYLLEDGSGTGLRVWDPVWGQWVNHLFSHPSDSAFGMGPVLAIQRPGNAAFLVQPWAFLGTGGVVVALWCTEFLILGGAILLLRRSLRDVRWIALLATVFLLGTRALASYQLNENGIALGLSLILLHLLLERRRVGIGAAVAAGLVFAHLVGIRPATLTLLPAVLLLQSGGIRRRGLLLLALVLAATPWLLTNHLGLGGLLRYPQLEAGHQAQVLFAGTALEWSFTFHPLNWPVADTLMRSPHHAFPTLIRLPLEVLQALGAPLLTLVVCGLAVLASGARRQLVAALLWLLPIPLFLMLITALDYQKQSYVLLALAPIPWLTGMGLQNLDLGRVGRLALVACCVGAFVLIPAGLRDLQLPLDERAHVNHKRDLRDSVEEGTRREALTTASFLPYLGAELSSPRGAVGWSLLTHGQVPQDRRSDEETVLSGPVVITTALTPDAQLMAAAGQRSAQTWGGLPPAFIVETAAQPWVPPDLIGEEGVPGLAWTDGRLAFVVALPAPAPTQASVRLVRRGSSFHLSIEGYGETVAQTRYVSLLVISRGHWAATAPSIAVDGQAQSVWNISMWSDAQAREWRSQPRVISNEPWAVHWTGEAYTFAAGTPEAMALGPNVERECRSERHQMLRACIAEHCTFVLTDASYRPRALIALNVPGVRGSLLFSWGQEYPTPPLGEDRCVRQFLNLEDDRLNRFLTPGASRSRPLEGSHAPRGGAR